MPAPALKHWVNQNDETFGTDPRLEKYDNASVIFRRFFVDSCFALKSVSNIWSSVSFFPLLFRFIMNHNGLQTDAQRQVQPDFRAATMTIDNHLYDEDVDSMKFLCHGLVVASKLKRIQEAHELIDLLQSANHVTEENYSLLADLLQYIGRIDVLQKIGSDEMEVMVRRHNQGSKINPFYVLLFKIAEELPDEDVKKAMYMYGKVPKSQKVSSGIDLFTVMVQHQAVRPDNVSLLTTIFGSIERQDIVELINRYTGKNR